MRSLCVIVGCHMTGGCAWFVTEAYHWATTAWYTTSHLSLFNYLNIKPQHTLEWNFFSINNLSNVGVPDEWKFQHGKTDLCQILCHVTVTIIKVIATVKIIWITLMDLIEFNIKIKIKKYSKKCNKKKSTVSQILIETLNQPQLRLQSNLIQVSINFNWRLNQLQLRVSINLNGGLNQLWFKSQSTSMEGSINLNWGLNQL